MNLEELMKIKGVRLTKVILKKYECPEDKLGTEEPVETVVLYETGGEDAVNN